MISLGSSECSRVDSRGYTKITKQPGDYGLLSSVVLGDFAGQLKENQSVIAGVEIMPGHISFFCQEENQSLESFFQELKNNHYSQIIWYIWTK